MNVLGVILAIIITVAVIGVTAEAITGGNFFVPQTDSSTPIEPTSVPSGDSSMPGEVQPTGPATVIPTATPTHTVAPTKTVSPLQQEGATLLAGNWYGTKSMLFGTVSGEFYATGKTDGTATFSGVVRASSFGFDNAEFSTPATWEYLGNNQFKATISDTDTTFTCDGTTLTITLNAYKFGFVDTAIANLDIPVDLKRV